MVKIINIYYLVAQHKLLSMSRKACIGTRGAGAHQTPKGTPSLVPAYAFTLYINSTYSTNKKNLN